MLRAALIAVVLAALAAVPARAATVTVGYPSYPDFTDPQLGYTVAAWQISAQTHLGLLTYARAEGPAGTQLIPGLAEAMPAISPDGLTYTFRLRRGLRYSNGGPVRARDFEHAVKRLITLESGGASFFSGTIAGAERYQRRGRARGDITGISARGRTITIRLVAPSGQFPYILTMPFASLVPSSTRFEVYTRRPVPGAGPMRITSMRVPNRIVLKRNPRFSIPGIPRATGDTVRIVRGARRPDLIDDPSGPAPAGTRLETTASTYYFFLNHRTPPFDRKEVRQAVNFAVDKPALRALFDGQLQPGCTFLPPALAPERQSEPCPYGDPNAAPQVERARQMIAAAGATGARVDVYGNTEEQTRKVTNAYVGMLDAIGLDARAKIVDGEVYFQTIGTRRTRAQTGFANWFQDFPHPGNFFFLVDPDTIRSRNNQNFGNVGDPRIKSELDRLQGLPLADAMPGYAALDRLLVDEASVVPYGYRLLPLYRSARIPPQCLVYHPVLALDFSRVCVA
jgi:peptide/nickel transport system substrate-binding protein